MYYSLISGLANVIFNYILTGLLGLGVIGVAAGTVLSNIISATLVLRRLMTTGECYRLDLRRIRLHKDKFKEIVKCGLPAGVQSAIYAIANLVVQSTINACDLAQGANGLLIAGHSAAGTVEGLFTTAIGAFGTAVTVFAGQNYGAGKMDRVDRVPKVTGLICTVIWVVVTVIALIGAPVFVGFTVSEPLALEYGSLRLRVAVTGFIFNMTADLFIAQSRGLGESFKPMIAAVFSVCIFRTLYLKTVYPMIGGYLAIILIFPISLLLNTIVQAIFYRSTRQRIGKELEAKAAQAAEAGVSA